MNQTTDAPVRQERPTEGFVGFSSLVGFMCGAVIGPTVALGASSNREVGGGVFFTSVLVGGILGATLMGMLGLLAAVSRSDPRLHRSPVVGLVMGIAPFIGIPAIVIGFALLPSFVFAGVIGGEPTLFVFTLGVPISLVVTGCGLMLISRRAMRYAKTFWIAASPGKVVDKVVLWGSGARRTKLTLHETTVIFTRRYRPVAWGILLGGLWLFLWVAWVVLGVVMFPASNFNSGVLFLVLGALFLFVRTTETLTVAATALGEGSQVTISGQAVPGLIRQLERLMATSTKGPTPKLPASPETAPAASTNAYAS